MTISWHRAHVQGEDMRDFTLGQIDTYEQYWPVASLEGSDPRLATS